MTVRVVSLLLLSLLLCGASLAMDKEETSLRGAVTGEVVKAPVPLTREPFDDHDHDESDYDSDDSEDKDEYVYDPDDSEDKDEYVYDPDDSEYDYLSKPKLKDHDDYKSFTGKEFDRSADEYTVSRAAGLEQEEFTRKLNDEPGPPIKPMDKLIARERINYVVGHFGDSIGSADMTIKILRDHIIPQIFNNLKENGGHLNAFVALSAVGDPDTDGEGKGRSDRDTFMKAWDDAVSNSGVAKDQYSLHLTVYSGKNSLQSWHLANYLEAVARAGESGRAKVVTFLGGHGGFTSSEDSETKLLAETHLQAVPFSEDFQRINVLTGSKVLALADEAQPWKELIIFSVMCHGGGFFNPASYADMVRKKITYYNPDSGKLKGKERNCKAVDYGEPVGVKHWCAVEGDRWNTAFGRMFLWIGVDGAHYDTEHWSAIFRTIGERMVDFRSYENNDLPELGIFGYGTI